MLHFLAQLFELLFYLAIPLALVALAFFFNVLAHELGHAVPLLFMTAGKVEIYVGSFGDPRRSIKCRIGRLHMFFKYNPFLWKKGLCQPPSNNLSINKRIFYVAMGPVVSLLLTITCWYLAVEFEFDGHIKLFLAVIALSSFISVCGSAIPHTRIYVTHSGENVSNDAALILQLFKAGKLSSAYFKLAEHMGNSNYREGVALLDSLLTDVHINADSYRWGVVAHLQLKNYARAAELNTALTSRYPLHADDYCNDGFIKSKQHQHAAAMLSYNKALDLDPNHLYALNNLGYSLCVLDRDAEAIPYFDKIVALYPGSAHGYDNRGWAQIKLGNLEEGLADVSHSLTLDPDNAGAYRNTGLYHLKKKDAHTAIAFLEKAKAMDPDIPLLDAYLAEAYKYNYENE